MFHAKPTDEQMKEKLELSYITTIEDLQNDVPLQKTQPESVAPQQSVHMPNVWPACDVTISTSFLIAAVILCFSTSHLVTTTQYASFLILAVVLVAHIMALSASHRNTNHQG